MAKHSNNNNNTTSSTHAHDNGPLWLDDSHLQPQWIQANLFPTTSQSNVRLTSCQARDISNAMRKGKRVRDGATLRLNLTWKNSEEHDSASSSTTKDVPSLLPTTIVLKQAVTPEGKALSKQLGLSREALFYQQLAPQIKNSHVLPRIYFARGDYDADGAKWIFMQDLNNRNNNSSEEYVDSGIFFGPGNPNNWSRNLDQLIQDHCQLNGIVGKPLPPPTPQHIARTTFVETAKIHALFWKQRDLLSDQYHWLRGHAWLQGQGQDSWRASQQMVQTFWESYVNAHDSNNNGDNDNVKPTTIEWNPMVRAAVEKAVQGISWEEQLKRLHENSHWTLVHGDYWPGNVLWSVGLDNSNSSNDDNSATIRPPLQLVDWEMVGLGSGPQELGQYVISNMNRSVRQLCEHDIVRAYYDELVKSYNTSNDRPLSLTWDECWREYQVGGVERWMWFLVYFLGSSLSNPAMTDWAQFFHNQIADFMEDHELTASDITQPRP